MTARCARALRTQAPELLGRAAVLLLPVCILYSRAGSEILIGVIGGTFLWRCAITRAWGWLREPWVIVAGFWWGWQVACSTPLPALSLGESGPHSLIEAVLLGRFLILTAALSSWLAREPALRRAMFASLSAAAAWIVVECWQQYLFGSNIGGFHRWIDGALTGPFRQPRAGPELVFILFPALLPPTIALLRRPQRWQRAAGMLLFAAAIATMVLIGQRMPALLTALGLLVCCLLLPRLRLLALGAGALAAIVLISTPLLSPPTFQKLVVHFAAQMRHFPQSDYGKLYIRATVMGLDHPLTGLGFDGFRAHCAATDYQRGLPALGISQADAAGPAGCNIHPHNHYLEAFTAAGMPGLVLFGALVVAWLAALGRGLSRAGPEQAGCFIAVLLALWPLASTSALFTLPNAGWLFLVLGAGLAVTAPKTLKVARRRATPRTLPPHLPIGDAAGIPAPRPP